jgi:hypothetical protein
LETRKSCSEERRRGAEQRGDVLVDELRRGALQEELRSVEAAAIKT